jgi:hypothetical protein
MFFKGVGVGIQRFSVFICVIGEVASFFLCCIAYYVSKCYAGYVALLGKPNVGKSTLANQMVGQKLSIVTDKPQTTRHQVLCICSGSDYQV